MENFHIKIPNLSGLVKKNKFNGKVKETNDKIPGTGSFVKKTNWDPKWSAAATNFITKTNSQTDSKSRCTNLEKKKCWFSR